MLTSEELFPPEYCFAGSCSSHLARSTRPSPLSPSSHLYPVYPSCRFPPSRTRPLPRLLHGDIVLTRLGTCNLFVPRPARGERAAFGRYTLPCTPALSLLSHGSPCRARKIRPTCSQRRALTRVHQRCIATVASSYGAPCVPA